jgi:hypothetical protein
MSIYKKPPQFLIYTKMSLDVIQQQTNGLQTPSIDLSKNEPNATALKHDSLDLGTAWKTHDNSTAVSEMPIYRRLSISAAAAKKQTAPAPVPPVPPAPPAPAEKASLQTTLVGSGPPVSVPASASATATASTVSTVYM